MADCTGASDISIQRGDTTPVSWQFLSSENPDVVFPITGYAFTLLITFDGGQRSYSTASSPPAPELSIDIPGGSLTWTPTSADSNAIPIGAFSQYQIIALLNGTVTTWISGTVTGLGNG